MKTLVSCFLFLSTFSSLGQTSIIGLKSHHGSVSDIQKAKDSFGEIAPMPVYDTIIKINNECVIQIGQDNGWGMKFRDTICDHWYYESVDFDEKEIQQYHGRHIVLIGFDDDGSSLQEKKSPFFSKRTNKQSSKWLFVLIALAALGTYIARPNFITKSKS